MSLSVGSRQRAVSTVSVAEPQDAGLRSHVERLQNLDRSSPSATLRSLGESTVLQELKHVLKDDDDLHSSKGGFRRVGGYQALLEVIKVLLNVEDTQPADSLPAKQLLQVLPQLLGALGSSLEGHAGNQRYFRSRLKPDGWTQLRFALEKAYEQCASGSLDSFLVEDFFGLLLASAAGEEMISDVYKVVSKKLEQDFSSAQQPSDDLLASVETSIKDSFAECAMLVQPEFLTLLVNVWANTDIAATRSINCAIPSSVKILLSKSRHNLVSAHVAGLSSAILSLLFQNGLATGQRAQLKDVALLLYQEGSANLNEAGQLFARAATQIDAASFLLEAVDKSRRPPSIQFDLGSYGYSSIELASLGRSFPPSDSAGYTLTLWARFDEFDANAHTTIFGAFDRTQTCFILVYLEKDTCHLILQTAIKGSRPSVRFRSVTFKADQWYHIAIVQRRPRTTSASRAFLFVDGEFMEQQKATYPSYPPAERGQRSAKVQSFLGTPQDLAPVPPGVHCSSKWSLASATLFQDALSDDLMSVFYNLGPHYHGNYQDCLGSFQTYKASAALNLRNEMLHPGKEEHSELIQAIRQKASDLIREDSILLNVSPAAVLDSDDRNNIDESQLVKSLSKLAAKNLVAYTRSGANAVAINGAVPAINDALTQARGVAMLMGVPIVAVPQPLDEATWRLGGCAPIVLGLVGQAQTTEAVATAVEILFKTVHSSWRNSEVMERERGYEILAMILKDKLAQHSTKLESNKSVGVLPTAGLDRPGLYLRLLALILEFVGYSTKQKEQAVINNPLAYKVLLVDSSLWRCGPSSVQELYFEQFQVFASSSQHSRFNCKRLTRTRVLRRLTEALKSETITKRTMQLYVETFRVLLPQAMSAELLRSFALFVTFAVNKRNIPVPVRRSTRRETRPRVSSNASGASQTDDNNLNLTHFEIGMEVLRFYSEVLCKGGDDSLIKRFAKTVTNKWLLYLLSETSPEVVVLSLRILARLLVVHGDAYVKKFKDKTGGFTIMCHRLKRWWHLPALWPCCFAILFDVDIAKLDLDRTFDLFSFVELFNARKELSIVYPEMMEVITGMLQTGLKTIVSSHQHEKVTGLAPPKHESVTSSPHRLSMSTMAPPNPFLTIVTSQHIETFDIVLRFLADLHSRSQKFRDFAATSSYVQDLLSVLFPVVVGSDTVEAIVELEARDSRLTFDGDDVVVQPLTAAPPIIRTTNVETSQEGPKGKTLRRGSTFVLVTREKSRNGAAQSRFEETILPTSPIAKLPELNERHAIVQSLLEMVVSVFMDQILTRKDFPGLGLFLRTPPGFVEHQSFFESWILRNTVSQLSNHVALNQRVLTEPKVLTNLARLFSHMGEALFEGWFIGGAESVLDLSGSVLEYLQQSDIAELKAVRLCSQAVTVVRAVVFRIVLLSLSQVEGADSLAFLEKLTYWQTVLLAAEETQSIHLQLVCYMLYASLVSSEEAVRNTAANLWRIILVQKPSESAAILSRVDTAEHKRLVTSFEKLVELDNETFLYWVGQHRDDLDAMFAGTLSKSWDLFVAEENKRTEEGARARISRRREKLKQWARDEEDRTELIRCHEVTFDHWTANIFSSEHMKHQRLLQDHQDDMTFTETNFSKMQRDTSRTTGVFAINKPQKWRLDQTEGRNRMRLRLHEDLSKPNQEHQQPKRKGTEAPALQLDTKNLSLGSAEAIGVTPGGALSAIESPKRLESTSEPFPDVKEYGDCDKLTEADDSFELVEDPNEGLEEYEDKNRKVMRSLHRGDQVKHVANISRVLGLEAVEGLLILGKDYIYLIDNFFQRADGEIVHVWQAPQEERDSYIRMISGKDISIRKAVSGDNEHETRSWKWSDVISISKRRFLFRDVAIETFFADGRSYLLTVISAHARNELHSLISAKAPQFGALDSPRSESSWRYETLKSVEDEPQGLGSRFTHVFGQTPAMTATKKWQKGELSNFHYLMLINTLAGRTYNDLTQYPVFPWVIADYTSEELDLTDPRSFRDLSKPMGCQTPEREAEFRERYKLFAEMSDHSAPAFHYGTHYSSAMIVTSYLIRLQPFVQAYLLLQGGTFDHPDRMFFSVEQAWRSASRVNMTDVRELTPEFFCLPDFLVNLNDFDFGTRQNSERSIGSVELPPWAKGDPRIFVAKNREALESPYVSKHLHQWIDLIFGHKQKGEAAVEAVNVFHHLSYQGAKDLDAITDPVERLATIGIIHNFGQTPYQIFQKAHAARDQTRHKYKRLDTAAESLTRLPSTLLDSEERVASLSYSWKSDKLLCSGAFRLNMPPNHDIYMEWGFSDNSVRFYSAESRKQIGLFEHLHIGQLSSALFADSRTLITAGIDCTVALWAVHSTSGSVDIQPKATLFAHRQPATVLALSRSFNALLSSSKAGELMLWDLNRCEFVRKIEEPLVVECACINDVSGNIVLCHGSEISIYTINGDLLLQQHSGDRSGEEIVSCACYEGAGNEWLERDIIFTGHKRGVVRVWSKTIRDGRFELELVRQLNHTDSSREDGGNVMAGISCILPMPQVVYTGDEDGKVCEWNCVSRH